MAALSWSSHLNGRWQDAADLSHEETSTLTSQPTPSVEPTLAPAGGLTKCSRPCESEKSTNDSGNMRVKKSLEPFCAIAGADPLVHLDSRHGDDAERMQERVILGRAITTA
jgi:hypothetical protein